MKRKCCWELIVEQGYRRLEDKELSSEEFRDLITAPEQGRGTWALTYSTRFNTWSWIRNQKEKLKEEMKKKSNGAVLIGCSGCPGL